MIRLVVLKHGRQTLLNFVGECAQLLGHFSSHHLGCRRGVGMLFMMGKTMGHYQISNQLGKGSRKKG